MLKLCSRQLLINSILGLMLAEVNEEGSDRGTERHICRKNMSAFLLLLTNCLLTEKHVVFSVSMARCGAPSQSEEVAQYLGSCLFSVLPDQPLCKWCDTEHRYSLSLETNC